MGTDSLEIKLFSKSGELIKKVTCHGGFITVLRAFSPMELGAYQRILAGVPGPERYSLTLNGEPFDPAKHIQIGFGEDYTSGEVSVALFLDKNGIPPQSRESVLLSYELDEILGKTFDELTPCQARRLRLLAATHAAGKVVMLNNPFEPLHSKWKERFAELMVEYVRNTRSIVIVPSLDFRPQSWIDNDAVARVQVGEHRQKTIGFDSSPNPLRETINEIRLAAEKENFSLSHSQTGNAASADGAACEDTPDRAAQSATIPHPHGSGQKQAQLLSSKFIRKYGGPPPLRSAKRNDLGSGGRSGLRVPGWIIGKSNHRLSLPATILSLCLITAAAYAVQDLLLRDDSAPQNIINPSQETPDVAEELIPDPVLPVAIQEPEGPAQEAADNPGADAALAKETPPPMSEVAIPDQPPRAVVKVAFVLDSYPPEIKKSILETAEGKRHEPSSAAISKSADSSSDPTHSELLKALQAAGSGDNTQKGSGITAGGRGLPALPSNFAEMNKEERRNLMREKFRLAIEHASQVAME